MYAKKMVFMLVAAFCCAAAVSAIAQEAPDHSKAQIEQMKRKWRAEDVPIHFVGRVLDLDGNPVPGATVTLNIKKFSPLASQFFAKIEDMEVQTDANGEFEIKGQKGSLLYIEDISKEGYALESGGIKVKGFHYGPGATKRYIFDPKHPVLFHLRKRGEGTFLVGGSGGTGFRAPETTKAFCLTSGWSGRLNKYSKRDRIELMVTFSSKDGKAVLTFKPTGSQGGIVVSDKKLYSAPAEGYRPTYEVATESSERKKLHEYLYIRGGVPATYSRMEADISVNLNEGSVYYVVVTNPYGNRNLEKIEHLPYEAGRPAGNTAHRYLDAGLLPPEPDFKAACKNPNKMYENWLQESSSRIAAMEWAKDHDPDFYDQLKNQSDEEWGNRQLEFYHKQKRELELKRKKVLEEEAARKQKMGS